jgi:site-specific DNA-methyltransferase (adenine-specific)
MGQTWDGGDIAFNKDFWKEVLRVMKPGAVLLSFAATRNYHRMAVAVEDAGFEIFDMINWIYGSGFPKRKNYLKPGHEPIVMARKGVNKSLNIDESRVPGYEWDTIKNRREPKKHKEAIYKLGLKKTGTGEKIKGRYPANVIHDGSYYEEWVKYFYCAKASKKEKGNTEHPTVKPLELMRYLVKLVTPKDGTVLDPFAGTGTTGEAALLEGRKYYLIEREKNYFKDIEKRLKKVNPFFV